MKKKFALLISVIILATMGILWLKLTNSNFAPPQLLKNNPTSDTNVENRAVSASDTSQKVANQSVEPSAFSKEKKLNKETPADGLSNQIAASQKFNKELPLGHSAILFDLSDKDKKAFREVDKEGRKATKLLSMGKKIGEPLATVGPLQFQTKPLQAVYLRAIDKGNFINGSYEIFLRANEKGLVQADFQLGQGLGEYRVIIHTAGCGVQEISYFCEKEEINKADTINSDELNTEPLSEVK